MTLDTSRLQLRPYAPEHFLALFEGMEEFHRSFGLRAAEGLRGFIDSGDVSPRWLEQLRAARGADPWAFGFAVVDRASSLVIGNAGFKGPPDGEGMVEIAYGIVPAFAGQGCATEAARALIDFAGNDPRVRLIRAHTRPANHASTRVLTKNGFVKVGELVDPEDGPVWRWERPRGIADGQAMIRVVLPFHLRTLARVDGEVELAVVGPVTQRSILDALEARHPVLRGTIRDQVTKERRAFLRFFACQRDLSHDAPDAALPQEVARGEAPLLVVGAMAGG